MFRFKWAYHTGVAEDENLVDGYVLSSWRPTEPKEEDIITFEPSVTAHQLTWIFIVLRIITQKKASIFFCVTESLVL